MRYGRLGTVNVDALIERETDRLVDSLYGEDYATGPSGWELAADGYEIDRCLVCNGVVWHEQRGNLDCDCEEP